MIKEFKKRRYAGLDWAMKKLLRSKTNFGILEGFLSELLNEDIKIDHLLESESNKETESDKFNRVDMLVRNDKGEIIIIEVQCTRELDYFHRMLYGTSKIISEYMEKGYSYEKVVKVISVNLVYFQLGQGDDYLYEGRIKFTGRNKHDNLLLNQNQKKMYKKDQVFEIYPEYYLIKVNNFNDMAKSSLDEWIYFLKNGNMQKEFKAKGLKEASDKLDIMKFNDEERAKYNRYLENIRYQKSSFASSYKEGIVVGEDLGLKKGLKEGLEKGKEKEKIEIAKKMKLQGSDNNFISEVTGLSESQIVNL